VPTYKLKLEVEVYCPTREGQPELTITPAEIRESLLKTKFPSAGYAVCAPGIGTSSKLTGNMRVTKLEFEPLTCEHCGNKVPVPE
jgi:hypothetical protein